MRRTLAILLLTVSASTGARASLSTGSVAAAGEFERWAAPRPAGAPGARPLVLAVVDHRDRDRAYFIDTRRYDAHDDFLADAHLTVNRGQALYAESVDTDARRFTMAFLRPAVLPEGGFELELWSDDHIPAALLARAHRALSAGLPEPATLRPLNPEQAQAAAQAGVPSLPFVEPAPAYEALNAGRAVGRLKIVEGDVEKARTSSDEILVFRRTPRYLPALAGFLLTRPASALSHMVMLSRALGVPGAVTLGAEPLIAELEGREAVLEIHPSSWTLRAAAAGEAGLARARRARPKRRLSADLDWRELTALSRQRGPDSRRFGAKSANLGEVMAAVPEARVPPGFTIPFSRYADFIRRNGLEPEIRRALDGLAAASGAVERRALLDALRARIESGTHDPDLEREVAALLPELGGGVFVRSSTNAEDLTGFTGAGLYTTVPNAVGSAQALDAVKKVWASIWNERAVVAREAFGIDHLGALPAVLIQRTAVAQSAGVMATADPARRGRTGIVLIEAKKGFGERVVEATSRPERAVYRSEGERVEFAGASADDTAMRAAPEGGLRRERIAVGARVLDEDRVRALGRMALRVQKAFAGVPQDIEWVIEDGKVVIVQSRPYPE
ncbi:MAG: PEP/pyruvate-binding domain-containing protein [Elusimicrobia bacterium]|nr:PEP/pyruvate-binding domain-containing protein [Elusimicrobiota bacterium]